MPFRSLNLNMKFLAWPRHNRYNVIFSRYGKRFKLIFVLSIIDWWVSYYLIILVQQWKILHAVLDQDSQLRKNQIFCLKKQLFIFLWGFSHVFSLSVPTKFSLVCFVPLNKNEQSSFSEHVDPKLFLTFLLISTHLEKKSDFHRHFRKHW